MTQERNQGRELPSGFTDERLFNMPEVMLKLAQKLEHLPPEKLESLFIAILYPSEDVPDIDWDVFDEALKTVLTMGDD